MEITIENLVLTLMIIFMALTSVVLCSWLFGALLCESQGKRLYMLTDTEVTKYRVKGFIITCFSILIGCNLVYVGDWTITIPI